MVICSYVLIITAKKMFHLQTNKVNLNSYLQVVVTVPGWTSRGLHFLKSGELLSGESKEFKESCAFSAVTLQCTITTLSVR